MIGNLHRVGVWAHAAPVDMRKGFDGLCAVVEQELGRDPLCGDLFLFVSRDRIRAKILCWDGTGLCLYAKRLERQRFAKLWELDNGETVKLSASELQLFLEGVCLVDKIPLSPPPIDTTRLDILSTL